MAITIDKAPDIFTPSGNPNIFKFSSTQSGLIYFDVVAYKAASVDVIGSFRVTPTPDTPTSGYLNMQRVVDGYVYYEFKNYVSHSLDTFSNNYFKYFLSLTEYYSSGSNLYTGSTTSTSDYYVFEGELDRISFRNYTSSAYVLPKTTDNIKFLTTKPQYSGLYPASEEGLYFLTRQIFGTVRARIQFRDEDGGLLSSVTSSVSLSDSRLFRLNISPAYLETNLGADFSGVKGVHVYLEDGTSTPISETRVYKYMDIPCYSTATNVHWVNQFGVLDSYLFFNPEASLNVERTSIKKNPMGSDLLEYGTESFNTMDEILSTTPSITVRLTTRDLSDSETRWFQRLLLTKQAYVIMDGFFIPVTVADTSYNMMKKRAVQGINIKQFDFKFSDGFLFGEMGTEWRNTVDTFGSIILSEDGYRVLLEDGGLIILQ